MPLQGIVNTARALSYYERLQEVTANNLANANSDGFKADRLGARNQNGENFPVPVQSTDLTQGALRDTGRKLDLALEGPGYFVVSTARGERLIRGGSMRLDPDGRIVDMQGNAVLGVEGPILVTGAELEVSPDGTVLADGSIAGKLRIETVDDPMKLRKEGFGRYIAPGATRSVDEGETRLRQGSVEDSNLDPLMSMIDLVSIQRAYTSNIEALRAMDSVLGAIANEVGRV
jgi:flagellar basal body rod protein FlgG